MSSDSASEKADYALIKPNLKLDYFLKLWLINQYFKKFCSYMNHLSTDIILRVLSKSDLGKQKSNQFNPGLRLIGF